MAIAVAFRFREREYYQELNTGDELLMGCHKKDTVQIPNSKEHLLIMKNVGDEVKAAAAEPLHLPSSLLSCNELMVLSRSVEATLYLSRVIPRSAKAVNLPYNGSIRVGRHPDNDIVVSYPIISGHHFQLQLEAGQVHVQDQNSTNGLYLNGKRISKAIMKSGDVLSIYTFHFILQNGMLYFENIGSSIRVSENIEKMDRPAAPDVVMPKAAPQKAVQPKAPGQSPAAGGIKPPKAVSTAVYPQYQLSPRIREQLPHEPIILSSAPGHGASIGGRRSNFAYLISSGAMLAASLATGMLTPAALLMRAAGMISPLANMAMYNKMSKEERQQLEEYEKMRQERYQAYIDSQKARICKVADVQRRILTAENPAPAACMDTVKSLKRNLWERMPSDSDFLTVRLGIGKVKLCVEVKSRANTDGFVMEDDELEELAGQIIEETRYVENVPVRVSLKEQRTVGIVGEKADVFYQLRSMLVELATMHSFRDVHIIGLFEEDSMKTWGLIRWLPHIWDESGQVRYIAFDEKRRHTVCELLADMIRRRKLEAHPENGTKQTQVLPHYIIIAENQKLLQDESIYEDLVSNNPALGITTVLLASRLYELPQTCQYIVDLSEASALAYEREKYDERSTFRPDAQIHTADLKAFARKLAAVELKDRASEAELPSSITFLQGYHARRVEDLDVFSRWERSEPHRTLAAPIGMMAGRKLFYLNVLDGNEAHGPHGLLAGTTGSGKSELLQSWILSMAVSYHPHDVNFVIIDYKGGGMSDLMEPLPHVVGKITNISRNIGRSLVSLKSEVKRRQQLFAEYGVNNIEKYQRAYRNGEAKERLPHLIIVTDEFAEMKKEEPEFMTELNSIAAVGRSLGVHMLLATQKPAGVVTDQISANSRFRICMKVQDVADSREMLKRPDAARITQAGRAYVRVGEDELFELFQSFYSAAGYSETITDKMSTENLVRVVGVTGNRINPLPKKKKEAVELDELTAVIKYINRVCKEHGIEKMAGPWLPELPDWLTLEELGVTGGFDGASWNPPKGLIVPVGRYDIPAAQAQGVQALDFMGVGHYGVYGSNVTGKTFFLKTVLVGLCRYYTPAQVNVYVIDANTWSMTEFSGMPQVRQVILNSEAEKLQSFAKKIYLELEARRKAFQKHAVSSLAAYREAVAKDTPAIVVMIDQIKPMFEQSPEMSEVLQELAASGATYGIYLIYTTHTSLGLSYKFTQLIKGCVTFQMPEKGDYSQLVGPIAGISLPNVQGRALMRGNPPVAFQAAVYADAKEDTARHEQILALAEQMTAAWNASQHPQAEAAAAGQEPVAEAAAAAGEATYHGEVTYHGEAEPKAAPVPEKAEEQNYDNRSCIPIGTYSDDMEPAFLDLAEQTICLICAEHPEHSRAFLKRLEGTLRKKPEENSVVLLNEMTHAEVLPDLKEKLNERLKLLNQNKKKTGFVEKDWILTYMQICVLIEDLPKLMAVLPEADQKTLRMILSKSAGLGVIVLMAVTKEELLAEKKNIVLDFAMKKQFAVIVDGNPIEYSAFQIDGDAVMADMLLDEDESAVVQDGRIRFVRSV